MNIDITSRHFTASAHLKNYILEKVHKIVKFNNGIINCHIILTKENNSENVEIIAHSKGFDYIANVSGDVFERSLKNALDKIVIQIKKKHEKIIGH